MGKKLINKDEIATELRSIDDLTQQGKKNLIRLENVQYVIDVFCNRTNRHYTASDKVILMQNLVIITHTNETCKLLKQIKERIEVD